MFSGILVIHMRLIITSKKHFTKRERPLPTMLFHGFLFTRTWKGLLFYPCIFRFNVLHFSIPMHSCRQLKECVIAQTRLVLKLSYANSSVYFFQV